MKKLIELFITLGGKVIEQKPTKPKKGSLDKAIAEYHAGKTTRPKIHTTSSNNACNNVED